MANCWGQLGSESFDWRAVDLRGADVRRANIKGNDEHAFAAFTSNKQRKAASNKISPDTPVIDVQREDGTCGRVNADLEDGRRDKNNDADVRAPNVTGQIGDKEFNKMLKKEQTPLTVMQQLWRLCVFMLPIVMFVLVIPIAAAMPSS